MAVGRLHRGRSAIKPPASFAKLDRPSDTPSITPSATAGAPRLARNAGRIAVPASCPQSEKRLARPMPSTPRVSQRFDDEDGAAGSLMVTTRQSYLMSRLRSTQRSVGRGRIIPMRAVIQRVTHARVVVEGR